MRRIASRIAIVCLFVALVAAAAIWGPSALEQVARLNDAGPAGDAAFAFAFGLGGVLMLPASWFQGAAGFLYGPLLGVCVSWLASTAVGAVSFELARAGLRELVATRIPSGRVASLDRALVRRGLTAVILLRMSPLAPYNVVSYGLGLTAVPRRTFWIGTTVGSVFPATTWALVGASLGDLSALTTGEASFGAARWVVLAVTLVASAGIALFVRKALAEDASADAPV